MAAGGVAVKKENSDLQLLPDSDFNSNITAGKMFPQWAGVKRNLDKDALYSSYTFK